MLKDNFQKKVSEYIFLLYFLKILFTFKERERNINVLEIQVPYQGLGLQPRHVPWLGIELATVWFAGWHSIHWPTPARARALSLEKQFLFSFCPAKNLPGSHSSQDQAWVPCPSPAPSRACPTPVTSALLTLAMPLKMPCLYIQRLFIELLCVCAHARSCSRDQELNSEQDR